MHSTCCSTVACVRMRKDFQQIHDQLTTLVVSDCISSYAFWVYTGDLFLLIYFYLFLIMCKLTFCVYVCVMSHCAISLPLNFRVSVKLTAQIFSVFIYIMAITTDLLHA